MQLKPEIPTQASYHPTLLNNQKNNLILSHITINFPFVYYVCRSSAGVAAVPHLEYKKHSY